MLPMIGSMKVGEVGEAEATVGRWWSAWQDKDLDAIMRLALPRYVEFTGHSAEHRVGRNTLVAVASGSPVVLIHGGGLDSRMWNESFHALARSYRVVRYDVRGFGRSAPPTAPFSHVDDLARVLDRAGIDSAALVGLSLGGAIALNFALVHPDRVDRLLLIGPAVPGAASGSPRESEALPWRSAPPRDCSWEKETTAAYMSRHCS